MAGETLITMVGNLTADPELRYTPSGAAVANFTIASTPRHFNVPTSQWHDGDPLFLRCSLWREAATHLVDSLKIGDRMIATGKLVARSWTTSEGEKRTVLELAVDEIGAFAEVDDCHSDQGRTERQCGADRRRPARR